MKLKRATQLDELWWRTIVKNSDPKEGEGEEGEERGSGRLAIDSELEVRKARAFRRYFYW